MSSSAAQPDQSAQAPAGGTRIASTAGAPAETLASASSGGCSISSTKLAAPSQ